MHNTTQKTDQKPWYKQFWPWFIMAIPACGVIAGITTVFIANSHAPIITNTHIERFGRIAKPALDTRHEQAADQ